MNVALLKGFVIGLILKNIKMVMFNYKNKLIISWVMKAMLEDR